ncbi:MAG: pentapeptide repeat-containing protein [Ruminococcus sp.]|nr:pentapeptide repeat-containing protein [Ruminococcus sp.]
MDRCNALFHSFNDHYIKKWNEVLWFSNNEIAIRLKDVFVPPPFLKNGHNTTFNQFKDYVVSNELRFCLLVGEAGSGKSSIVSFLVYNEEILKIKVYVFRFLDSMDKVLSTVKNVINNKTDFKDCKTVIIFEDNGFRLDVDSLYNCLDEHNQICDNISIIFTARTDLVDNKQSTKFPIFEVLPFSDEQIQCFIEKTVNFEQEKIVEFILNSDVSALRNPVVLSLVTKNPDIIYRGVQRLFDVLLSNIDEDEKKLYTKIAGEMFCYRTLFVEKNKYLKNKNQLLFIKCSDNQETLFFSHKSLQEYFEAKFVYELMMSYLKNNEIDNEKRMLFFLSEGVIHGNRYLSYVFEEYNKETRQNIFGLLETMLQSFYRCQTDACISSPILSRLNFMSSMQLWYNIAYIYIDLAKMFFSKENAFQSKIFNEHFKYCFNIYQAYSSYPSLDFSGLDLSYFDFSNMNLKGTKFENCNLIGCCFSYCDLSSVSLKSSNLKSAVLKNANLSCANLYQANLYEVDLQGAFLSSANLSKANIAYSNLKYCNLDSVNFENANLLNSDLSFTNGIETIFNNANLNGVSLLKTSLVNASFVGANLLDIFFEN